MSYEVRGIIGAIRNAAAVGVVSALDDSGGAQTLNLSTASGVNRADVEVMTPWGFAASPPTDGMIALVFPLGGDAGNLVALAPSNPSARMGMLEVGEVAIYGGDGSRVHVRQGGIVEIWGGAQVNVHTLTSTINAPNGCTVNGPATVNGAATVNGPVTVSGDAVLKAALTVGGNATVDGNLVVLGTITNP